MADTSDNELVPSPTLILPYLLLGGSAVVRNDTSAFQKQYNVKHVICVASDCKNKQCYLVKSPPFASAQKFIVSDGLDPTASHPYAYDFSSFEKPIKFIQDTVPTLLPGETIYIHCQHGRSRSAALVIAYIMAQYKKNLKESYTLVKNLRPFIGPHMLLKGALIQYERYLRHVKNIDFGDSLVAMPIKDKVEVSSIPNNNEWSKLEKQIKKNYGVSGLEAFDKAIQEEEMARANSVNKKK